MSGNSVTSEDLESLLNSKATEADKNKTICSVGYLSSLFKNNGSMKNRNELNEKVDESVKYLNNYSQYLNNMKYNSRINPPIMSDRKEVFTYELNNLKGDASSNLIGGLARYLIENNKINLDEESVNELSDNKRMLFQLAQNSEGGLEWYFDDVMKYIENGTSSDEYTIMMSKVSDGNIKPLLQRLKLDAELNEEGSMSKYFNPMLVNGMKKLYTQIKDEASEYDRDTQGGGGEEETILRLLQGYESLPGFREEVEAFSEKVMEQYGKEQVEDGVLIEQRNQARAVKTEGSM